MTGNMFLQTASWWQLSDAHTARHKRGKLLSLARQTNGQQLEGLDRHKDTFLFCELYGKYINDIIIFKRVLGFQIA